MAEQDNPGYHLTKIEAGQFGEASKIFEEIDEFDDALKQGSQVMAIVELCDLIGAIRGWLAKYHPGLNLEDLIKFADITERAFVNGHREPKA